MYSDSSPNNNNNCNTAKKCVIKTRVSFIDKAPRWRFFFSPQKTSRIFLLFSFCFVLFGACRIQRDCFCYCCNKRHNSCWTIWISTQYTFVCVCMSAWQADSRTERDRHVWEYNKNLISRILARTVIENFSLPSPHWTILHKKLKPTNKQRAWHLKHLAIALALALGL